MASSVKLKMLYLMKILLEKTDDHHALTAADLIRELAGYDIKADRKSIYSDIDTLREFGIDIVQQKGAQPGYYIGMRDFELPELKLLVDAVQSSKFITSSKSAKLIKKLEQLTSVYDAKGLRRDVFIYNRSKTGNETIYYNVDQIHLATHSNKQIRFHYREWTVAKNMRLKKDGAAYVVSPWTLCWAEENYYLIAYVAESDSIKHYRVDKMIDIEVLAETRLGKEQFRDFDLAAFSKKTFSMFGGQDEELTMRCHNAFAGVILDRFGKDVMIRPVDEEHFHVRVPVSVSPQFFGWLTGMGHQVEVVEPMWVRTSYQEYLEQILCSYEALGD